MAKNSHPSNSYMPDSSTSVENVDPQSSSDAPALRKEGKHYPIDNSQHLQDIRVPAGAGNMHKKTKITSHGPC